MENKSSKDLRDPDFPAVKSFTFSLHFTVVLSLLHLTACPYKVVSVYSCKTF